MTSNLAERTGPTQNHELTTNPEMNLVREAAARLYGQGYKRPQIARILRDHLTPNSKLTNKHRRFIVAKNKLARWEKEQMFRDLIYDQAVVKLDLDLPAILGGVSRVAKRGNIMAARLALEVTGRHNPKGEAVPTQIAIIVNDIPRPSREVHTVVSQAVEAEDDEV